jgi:hypothetical protein
MSAYSLSEHMAKAIWFSRWEKGLLAVFSAYFDASGDETDRRTRFISVSGFIAAAPIWIEFEKLWLERLATDKIFGTDGLPEFHMSDCANFTYAFEKWKDNDRKRQALLRDLINIVKLAGRKVSCIVDIEKFKSLLDEDIRDKFGLTAAYVLAGRACGARVKEWCWLDGSPHLSQVQFFFERGDGKEIQLDLGFRLLNDDYPEPSFKPKRNRYSKKGELIEERLIPFQASDILAYMNYLNAKFEGQSWRDKENIRWVLEELAGIPETPIKLGEELLPSLNILLRSSSFQIARGES